MYILRIILTAFIFLVLQITLVHHFSIVGASPDLVIVLLVALVLDRDPVTAVIIGFFLGFLQDLGNASFLGMNALAKSIIAYGVSHIGGGLFPESTLFKGSLIFAASIVNDIVVLVVTTSFSAMEILTSFFRYSILSALYSAVVGMAILGLIGAVTRKVVRSGAGY